MVAVRMLMLPTSADAEAGGDVGTTHLQSNELV